MASSQRDLFLPSASARKQCSATLFGSLLSSYRADWPGHYCVLAFPVLEPLQRCRSDVREILSFADKLLKTRFRVFSKRVLIVGREIAYLVELVGPGRRISNFS